MACCENEHPRMAPGQEPYTCEQLRRVNALIQGAADDDPGEENESYYQQEYLRQQENYARFIREAQRRARFKLWYAATLWIMTNERGMAD